MKREIGVDLFPKKSIIETRLKIFCEEKNLNSFRQLFEKIQYDRILKQELVNLLTVNETYFYRELVQLKEAIDFLKERPNSEISVLCAPCATGEEVYTISMMIQEESTFSKRYKITGIDINTEAIDKAKAGTYNARSLHRLTEDLKSRYFSNDGEKYQVRSEKFLHVDFSSVNIFDDRFLSYGKYDIVFSRNMLIYFDENFRLQAMNRFGELLKDDGRIYLGHADIVPESTPFEKHGFGSSCYYTKKKTAY